MFTWFLPRADLHRAAFSVGSMRIHSRAFPFSVSTPPLGILVWIIRPELGTYTGSLRGLEDKGWVLLSVGSAACGFPRFGPSGPQGLGLLQIQLNTRRSLGEGRSRSTQLLEASCSQPSGYAICDSSPPIVES